MNNKLRDAVYGFAIADALGVPYEFKKRGTFKCKEMTGYGTWNQPAGTWSDDTSMLLATCDSINSEYEKIDVNDLMEKFYQWRYEDKYTAHGNVFDIGGTTEKAIKNYTDGVLPLACGLDDEFSNGNGSLMRILPLAFLDNLADEDIANISSLTHAHNISKEACILYVAIAKRMILGEDLKHILNSFVIIKKEPFNRLWKLDSLLESKIKSTGYVVDSLEAALWCVVHSKNYKDCVLRAVNLGGDTDTIAALAGGLAGIKYGYDSIPKNWVEQLANKELIEKCLF